MTVRLSGNTCYKIIPSENTKIYNKVQEPYSITYLRTQKEGVYMHELLIHFRKYVFDLSTYTMLFGTQILL